jgi:hypothetical protein
MSFFFNRGLWKQKPSMYGPVSAVQRDIFLNAERAGIDPGSIALCLPMWGPGDQVDYARGVICSNYGAVFSDDKLRFDATSSNYLRGSNCTFTGSSDATLVTKFSPTAVPYEWYNAFIFSAGNQDSNRNLWSFNRDGTAGREARFQVSGSKITFDFLIDTVGVKYSIALRTRSEAEASLYAEGKKYTDGSLKYNIPTTNNDYMICANPDVSLFGDYDIYYVYFFNVALPYSQIALLSDHPYILLQRNPQRTFSFPTGSVLPTPVNLAGVPGLNSITWTWQSGA